MKDSTRPIPAEDEINEATRLFSLIDSSIAFMFGANLSSARRFEIIDLPGAHGAYFCYDDGGIACVYVAFERETAAPAAHVADLCAEDIRSFGTDGVVYLWSGNELTADRLRRDFVCSDERCMTELMLSRADHRPVPLPPELSVRGYQAEHLADYLSLLAVDPKYQRKGYGAALLSHAASALFSSDERDDLTLYCMDSNPSAFAFYGSRGLRVTGRSRRMALSLR